MWFLDKLLGKDKICIKSYKRGIVSANQIQDSRRAEFLASVPLPGPDVAERIADAGVDRADIRRGGLALSSAVRELAPDRDGNAFEFDADFCIRAADVRAGDAADRSFFRAAFPDAGIPDDVCVAGKIDGRFRFSPLLRTGAGVAGIVLPDERGRRGRKGAVG